MREPPTQDVSEGGYESKVLVGRLVSLAVLSRAERIGRYGLSGADMAISPLSRIWTSLYSGAARANQTNGDAPPQPQGQNAHGL